jgi:hypothetical protein
MPDWRFDASHRKVRDRVSGDKHSKNNRFSDIYIQEVFTTSGFVLLIVLEVIPFNLPPRLATGRVN